MPFVQAGVPEAPLRQALRFLELYSSKLAKEDRLAIADYTQSSRRERFYMLDLSTGRIERYRVSHGGGTQQGVRRGDPDHDGFLDRCMYKNQIRNMTRPGFFRTAELYTSRRHYPPPRNRRYPHQWPLIDGGPHNGLRLDGLSPGVNHRARQDGVVMHGAWYNYAVTMGRSYGCPAFTYEQGPRILPKLKGGILFYAYAGDRCPQQTQTVLRQVPGWSSTCNL